MVMEKWYSVAELAEETGIPEPSLRRYLARFSIYVVSKGGKRAKKYDPTTIELLNRVKSLYDSGYETEGIKKLIKNEFPMIISDKEMAETAKNVDTPSVVTSEDLMRLEKNLLEKMDERFSKQDKVFSLVMQKLEQREREIEQKERQLEEREQMLLKAPEEKKEEASRPAEEKKGFLKRFFKK